MIRNGARAERGGSRGMAEGRQWQHRRVRPILMALEERTLLSSFVVNNPTDTPVAGETDLRQAIASANSTAGANTITFDGTVFATPQTITLGGTQLTLSNTTGTQTITAPAAGVTVSGGGNSRVFQVDSGVTASISGLAITGGNAGNGGGLADYGGNLTLNNCTISGNSASFGGGLNNSYGMLTLTNCTVSGNSAAARGGGVYTAFGATSTLTECTVSGNTATSESGGGLFTLRGTIALTNCTVTGNSSLGERGGGVNNYDGRATLTNCTISGNSALVNGGGINNYEGNTTVINCTVSGNTCTDGGGGGIDNMFYGTLTMGNTIVAGNTAATGPDAYFPTSGAFHELIFTSLGNNLIGKTDGSSGWIGSDLTGTIASPLNPLLAPLADFGGPTQTMALLSGSPAIDAGNNALIPGGITTDQRGFARIASSTVDIGAYEAQPIPLVVETTADGIGCPPGTLDLRGTVDLANIEPGAQTITIDPTVFATAQTIILTGTQLELSNTSGTQTITGPSAGVTVSGAGLSRVFQVDNGVTASLSGLTISGGSTAGYGGGLYNYGGTTTLTGVTISGNAAAAGGGLFNSKRGSITVISCSITGNSATNGGGGLYNYGGTATLSAVTVSGNSAAAGGGLFNSKRGSITVISCGITGNSATNGGGGLYNYGATTALSAVTISGNTAASGGGVLNSKRGSITVISCTIGDNSAAAGGGIDNVTGSGATLEDTIVADNTGAGGSPNDIGGDSSAGVVGTYDLVGSGGSGGLAGGTGNIVLSGQNSPLLAPLGNYGGPTQTMPLLPGSPAIGTGTAVPGVTTDQRGVPLGSTPDIGAFESQGFIITPVASSANAGAGDAFNNPLAVTVTAVDPVEPVAGGVVNFSVNVAPNGASASLSAATATIASNGIAEVTATANSILGSYNLNVSAEGAPSPASIALSNLVPLTFSGLVSQSIPVGTASATFSGTLANGVQIPQGESVAITLDGVTQQAAIGFAGAFSTTFDTAGIAASATAYTVSYAYTSDGTFADTITTSSLTVTKLMPTVTWANPADITYGTALSSTQLDATASVPGTFTYTPAPGTALTAGTDQALSVTFTPTDTSDYNTATGAVTINVDTATPIITWANPADITYGTALSATQLNATSSWTVGGVSGSVAGTFTYTPLAGTVLTSGTGHTLSVTFTPTDTTDFKSASDTVTINVDKATPTISWANPADITYGTALSATQLDATASVPGTFIYAPALDTVVQAGVNQTLSVTFEPTDSTDFATISDSVTINVDAATPIITWANPANIAYGTALSATQLDALSSWTVGGASGSVAGTFTYTPAAGTVLTSGTGHTLSVTFTPTDTTDFNSASHSVTINVGKATPNLTWANPVDITYGTALSAAQLDAATAWTVAGVSGAVAGSFTYTPAAGTVLHPGTGQALSVVFTPADTTDFNSTSGSVTINVDKAVPNIIWATPADITYGIALSATQLDAATAWTVGGVKGAVAGSFAYTSAAGAILHAGAQDLSVTFTPTDTTDFNTSFDSVTLQVDKATPTTAWPQPAGITFGTALSATQLDATSSSTVAGVKGSLPGSFTYTPAAGTVLDAGTGQTLSVTFTPTDTADYNVASHSVTINVAAATPDLAWANPADITFGTALSASQLDATTSWTVGGVSGAVAGSFFYSPAAGTVLPYGGATLFVTFTPTDTTDFNSTSGSVTINVDKAAPTLAWTNPADITYGTALSATQLDAAASVPGSFAYTPAAGTVLHAGSEQPLSVTFTPTDTADFSSVSRSVTVNVDKITPAVAWASPAGLTFGTALSAAQLDAAADATVAGVDGAVAGSFTYTPAPGTVLHAGTGQALSVTFAPTDTTDFNATSGSVAINVQPATPTIAWANPADIPFGTALSATQLDATASWTVGGVNQSVPGNFTFTPDAGTKLPLGAGQTLSVAFAPADPANFNSASATATVTVVPSADLTISQFTAAAKTVQIGDDLTYTIVVVNNGPSSATGVTVTVPLAGGASDVTGSGTATPSGTVNLQGSSVVASLGTLAVGASATVTFTVVPSAIETLTATASVTSNELDSNTSNNVATVSAAVVDRVGTIEFTQTAYAVPDNAGSASITVSRADGSRGTVTVDYKTVPINALPGLDFTPVSGTLTFPSGVSSQTIVVPVLDNPFDIRDELLSVVLSNVRTTEALGQPILGSSSTATLTIEDIDPNLSPLTVSGVQWTGTTQSITQILVAFSKPLVASAALNPANFALVNVGADGMFGTSDDSGVALSEAFFGSSRQIVVLTPAQPLPANRFFHLAINGGVEDVGENMLAGNGTTAGTSYTAMLARGTSLKYFNPAGARVSLRITGGGLIDDLLSGSGQGIKLSVLEQVPHHTVLSGTVRNARGRAGQAYLGQTISGLGRFGDVRVKLSSPEFRIGAYPFSSGSAAPLAARSQIVLSPLETTASSPKAITPKPAARKHSTGMSRTMNRPFHSFRHQPGRLEASATR